MTTPLWTAEEIAQATGGRASGFAAASGASIDTRTLQPGDLFFAIEGEARDGHDFVRAALENGAGDRDLVTLRFGLRYERAALQWFDDDLSRL